ncbi:MAG: hypothetical protein K1X87_04070 [Dehalococcoidia bacterium]|nr:hypothetical protein [Dehalococcoidia bacterium]HRC63281.1 hypothetical protein [Dehalococcoidia bacterium]
MFDELFELFERDRGRHKNGARPGLFGRLFGHHAAAEPRDDTRRHVDEDDDQRDERRRPRRRDEIDFDD